ncbi:MAG: site-specific integrase [Chloroflexota bacterium]
MARRSNGEGTIIQRKDGTWAAALRLEDGNRKWFYGKTKREVQTKLNDARLLRQQGKLVAEPSQPVSKYLNDWLINQVKNSRRSKTYDSYALNVRRAMPYIGRLKLDALKAAHLQQMYGKLLDTGLSPRSVEQVHGVLRIALRQAVKLGLLHQAPTAATTPPRSERREMRPLDLEEIHTLFASLSDDPLQALWVLLITTGIRLGEATGLIWADLDLREGTVGIRRAAQRKKGKGMVFVEPKTRRSRRLVHLAPGTVAALQAHLDKQKFEASKSGRVWNEDDIVFRSPGGKPLDPGYVRNKLHRALRNAELPIIRVHDLRHTAATYLLSSGTHPKVVQELLGHSSIALTLDTYSHVLVGLQKEVASQMDGLFRKVTVTP